MNMPEYTWKWLNKQDSEYVLGPKCAKILNMTGFSISEHSIAFWICENMPWQSSEHILGFKHARILNIARLWICKCYTGFQICHNMAENVWIGPAYAWICLNLQ